jgi:hypothetical protein
MSSTEVKKKQVEEKKSNVKKAQKLNEKRFQMQHSGEKTVRQRTCRLHEAPCAHGGSELMMEGNRSYRGP